MEKKYIDAEKLIELVKEWRSKQMGFAWDAVNEVLKIIDSLQQEQPEVDLEKEIEDYIYPIQPWQIREAPFTSIENAARHFYELGINAALTPR